MVVKFDGKLVLVAEDQAWVGIGVTECLEERGIFAAGPFSSSDEALTWLSDHTPDAAVIDVHFACVGLARELTKRLVPFIVFSGTPQSSNADAALASAVWTEYLVTALEQILKQPAPKTRLGRARRG